MEPLSFIEISAKHKLGLTLSECRSRVKLFKIDERMTLHQDEIMPEVQDSEGNLGTCSDVSPYLNVFFGSFGPCDAYRESFDFSFLFNFL